MPRPAFAVDEQWVVGAPRSLGNAQRCGECELVGRPFDEGLERVPRVHPAAGDRGRRGAPSAVVTGLCRSVGNLFDELLLGSVGDLHFDDELPVGGADFLESITHQRQVSRQDAVAACARWARRRATSTGRCPVQSHLEMSRTRPLRTPVHAGVGLPLSTTDHGRSPAPLFLTSIVVHTIVHIMWTNQICGRKGR